MWKSLILPYLESGIILTVEPFMDDQAYQLIEEMRSQKIPIGQYVDQSIVEAIYQVRFQDVLNLGDSRSFKILFCRH